MIERAYVKASRLGLELWCEDEGGPYQAIPQPGASFQPEGDPARRPHEYVRGGTAKLLTLFRPATGQVRAEAVEQTTNAVLHPWLKRQLEAILEQCPQAPELVPEGRRWQDWDIYPAAEQLDRFFPPVRVLLIWDNLAGHKSHSIVQWCAEHGILLLSTPHAGSWLNMAVQRIIKGRALFGQDYANVEELKQAPDFRGPGLESSPNTIYLGWQTTCSSRPGLRSTPPSGRIWSYYDLCSSSTHSLCSLLSQSGLMPLDLATDPLGTLDSSALEATFHRLGCLGDLARKSKVSRAEVKAQAEKEGIAPSTLWLYLKQYRDAGLSGLVRRNALTKTGTIGLPIR